MADCEPEPKPLYVVQTGNPGAGKSGLLNLQAQKILFVSEPASSGSGVTTELTIVEHDGVTYLDTPGLNDVDPEVKQSAARAISAALKKDGKYRVIFTIQDEAGRVRAADIAVANCVLEACKGQIKQNMFSIIVNKMASRRKDDVWNVHTNGFTNRKTGEAKDGKTERAIYQGVLISALTVKTNHILYIPECDIWRDRSDEDEVLKHSEVHGFGVGTFGETGDFGTWLKECPLIEKIAKAKVEDLDTSKLDEQIAQIQADNKKLQSRLYKMEQKEPGMAMKIVEMIPIVGSFAQLGRHFGLW